VPRLGLLTSVMSMLVASASMFTGSAPAHVSDTAARATGAAPPPFVTPPGGTVASTRRPDGNVVVTLRRADGSMYATRELDAAGRIFDTEYFDSSGAAFMGVTADYDASAVARHSVLGPRRAAADCGLDARNPISQKWLTGFNWYMVSSSIPANLTGPNALAALRAARVEWESNQSWCSWIGDSSSINFTYQGTIGPTPISNDGVNIVGWGDTSAYCSGSNIVGCTVRWYGGNNNIVGADIRLNTVNVTWSTASPTPSNREDVQSVMAHEIGHSIGFDHVSSSENVMWSIIPQGDASDRKLGHGDANENNAKY
jgi:hypothetical protein